MSCPDVLSGVRLELDWLRQRPAPADLLAAEAALFGMMMLGDVSTRDYAAAVGILREVRSLRPKPEPQPDLPCRLTAYSLPLTIARLDQPRDGISGVWCEGSVIVGTDAASVRREVERWLGDQPGTLRSMTAALGLAVQPEIGIRTSPTPWRPAPDA